MSVYRLVAPRATRIWGISRPQFTRLHVSKSSGLTSGLRNVSPPPIGGAFSLSVPAGKRFTSTIEKPEESEEAGEAEENEQTEAVIPDDPMNSNLVNRFDNKEDRSAAIRTRARGYVIIESECARNDWPFLIFGPFFLRENCQCPKCVHPETMQRTSDTFSIPLDVSLREINSNPEGAEIIWSDGHQSFYTWEWLIAHQQNRTPRRKWWVTEKPEPAPLRPYKPYQPAHDEYPQVLHDDVMSNDTVVLDWLEKIYQWGFCFVKGVPINPESTKILIERIAHIRHTHYGGFWDFTADLTFKDTAYTNEPLGAHTDNTYFTDPARLQLFHLLSHTDGTGGASLLVDGFAAARQLLKESPYHYWSLLKERHPWHASGNEDVCIQPSVRAPILSIHRDMGTVHQVRWNNYDRAPKSDWKVGDQRLWYEAAAHFNNIVNQAEKQIWTQLEPGTALIFDNWRMLHGRSEFTGKRRMCGGYVNNDDFISRFRLLKYGRQKVLNNLGNIWDAQKADNPYSIY